MYQVISQHPQIVMLPNDETKWDKKLCEIITIDKEKYYFSLETDDKSKTIIYFIDSVSKTIMLKVDITYIFEQVFKQLDKVFDAKKCRDIYLKVLDPVFKRFEAWRNQQVEEFGINRYLQLREQAGKLVKEKYGNPIFAKIQEREVADIALYPLIGIHREAVAPTAVYKQLLNSNKVGQARKFTVLQDTRMPFKEGTKELDAFLEVDDNGFATGKYVIGLINDIKPNKKDANKVDLYILLIDDFDQKVKEAD